MPDKPAQRDHGPAARTLGDVLAARAGNRQRGRGPGHKASAAARAPAEGRSELARLAARLPHDTRPVRSTGIRPVAAKTIGSFVPRLTRPAFEKYGFSAATLITDWATIVGADIARYTVPERLKWPRRVDLTVEDASDADKGRPGATLVLGVEPGRALDIQYKGRQLIERINAYFGYAAVAELRIVQKSMDGGKRGEPAVSADALLAELGGTGKGTGANRQLAPSGTRAKPADGLGEIANIGLRAALERMAAGLDARKARRIASG